MEAFRLFDEGVEQKLTALRAEEQPLDVLLLFDVSTSMRTHVQKLADAAAQAFRELRDGDRVAVMSFTTSTKLHQGFTSDRKLALEGVGAVLSERFRGGTHILAAVDDAAKLLLGTPRDNTRRRAVVVVTDNVGIRTRRESNVVTKLWEADAVACALLVPKASRVGGGVIGLAMGAGVNGITEKTGGVLVRTDKDSGGEPLAEMLRRLRQRYSLYYAMPSNVKAGEKRTVRVTLSDVAKQDHPGATVSVRKGYAVQ